MSCFNFCEEHGMFVASHGEDPCPTCNPRRKVGNILRRTSTQDEEAELLLLKSGSKKRWEAKDGQVVNYLSIFVKELVRALNKGQADHELSNLAMDYLRRNGLMGSSLMSGKEIQTREHQGNIHHKGPDGKCGCCDRGDEYNGFGSDGPTIFEGAKHCTCHD